MFKNPRLVVKILSGFLGLTIVTQILLGAWVRLTNSGMSCPDWPLCYGLFFPSYQKITQLGVVEYSYFQIFLEWIHRANAAFIIGPLTIILFLYIILNKKLDKIFKTYSFYLIALLGIQGLFGGLTVMKSNIPWSVALHLASAFFLFFIVINIFLLSLDFRKPSFLIKGLEKNLIYTSTIMILITACAGAFTSKYGASLACSKWPFCNDSLYPNFNDQFEVIHFFHRVLAFILVILLFFLFFRLKRYYNNFNLSNKIAFYLIPSIIFLQVTIGALLITYKIPIWMGIFHQFMGLLLFSTLSIFIFNVRVKSLK
ncbi:MAG: COX15/CtaA family protein [Pseudomonadota bacterium]|nr:COX15/CtaA family protein [Pseudomonadota bacterium]